LICNARIQLVTDPIRSYIAVARYACQSPHAAGLSRFISCGKGCRASPGRAAGQWDSRTPAGCNHRSHAPRTASHALVLPHPAFAKRPINGVVYHKQAHSGARSTRGTIPCRGPQFQPGRTPGSAAVAQRRHVARFTSGVTGRPDGGAAVAPSIRYAARAAAKAFALKCLTRMIPPERARSVAVRLIAPGYRPQAAMRRRAGKQAAAPGRQAGNFPPAPPGLRVRPAVHHPRGLVLDTGRRLRHRGPGGRG
jgi:hypothetical protein